jgi:hypothetical protein
MERKDWWPLTAPPPKPPAFAVALETKMWEFAGCWLDMRCRCGASAKPIRLLLTEGRHRADMPLRRAVKAFERCGRCGEAKAMALISDPNWQDHMPAGGAPHWRLTLNGPEAGAVAFTKANRR